MPITFTPHTRTKTKKETLKIVKQIACQVFIITSWTVQNKMIWFVIVTNAQDNKTTANNLKGGRWKSFKQHFCVIDDLWQAKSFCQHYVFI